ncbi:asparagine synthase (glutamine-hydrolyzing) [Terriglobus roseus]|uniref:asparagine synthase (glutamine-hydrolyzing) n=1 Tax=Terriglobus roseus TaxID=392734 RepID=A0A1G7K6T9_9BACT|nr:asparagine synthase (glutamine-hydrolyzing) [Terriglobus roseus]SDF32837.1 asparagine synthase (glutamine-hydrolysing) [Terriglobus roseus]
MCGIAGFLALKEQASSPFETLNTMAYPMRNRGPDAYGSWIGPEKEVGMAHRRLSIIDPTQDSDQPMHLQGGSLTIVFNGEIYNFRELRSQLEFYGHRFLTESDTEVLLHMYQQYGLDMLPMLRGMYAFAIWDRDSRTLVLARDPLGIKPMYYSVVDGKFCFASQVKSLTPLLDTYTPDPAGQAAFLLWGSVPEPYTLYREIRCMPAGSAMIVEPGCEPRIMQGETVSDVFAAAAEQEVTQDWSERQHILREALMDSVYAHMIADVPVALFLSAGLDSATIAGLLSERKEGSPETMTLGFTGGNIVNETKLASEIADFYGLGHKERYFGAREFAQMYEAFVEAMDQPTIDGMNVFMISRMAKDFGYKVAISGIGGDELFAGYPSFRQVPSMKRTFQWANGIPGIGQTFRWLSAPLLRRITSPKYAGLLEYGANIQGSYLLRRGLFMPWELKEVMDPDMARDGLRELEKTGLIGLRLPTSMQSDDVDKMHVHILEMTMYMRNQLLRDADWAGMANSVEIRVPFADWKLLKILAPYIVHGGFTKQDMVATPTRHLPPHILNRPKTGFAAPVRDWLSAGFPGEKPKRGLRGWALHLQKAFAVG